VKDLRLAKKLDSILHSFILCMTDAAEQESLGDQDVMAIISSLKDKSF
jgi:3-hydroxyisobutyrate dehydrogenase